MFGIRLQDVVGTDRLPISRPTARRLINAGVLKAYKLGKSIYIDPESLATLPQRCAIAQEA